MLLHLGHGSQLGQDVRRYERLLARARWCVLGLDIQSPGEGVMAVSGGTVTSVTEEAVEVDGVRHPLSPREPGKPQREGTLVLPMATSWQEPVVREGDIVPKRGLLARGITHIYFQANRYVFTGLVFVAAILMGIGMALRGSSGLGMRTFGPR